MKWTSEKPTQPNARWWARRAANGDIEFVEVSVLGKELVAAMNGSEEYESLDTFDLWFGPLEPPPIPADPV